jgi:hypothetical protein
MTRYHSPHQASCQKMEEITMWCNKHDSYSSIVSNIRLFTFNLSFLPLEGLSKLAVLHRHPITKSTHLASTILKCKCSVRKAGKFLSAASQHIQENKILRCYYQSILAMWTTEKLFIKIYTTVSEDVTNIPQGNKCNCAGTTLTILGIRMDKSSSSLLKFSMTSLWYKEFSHSRQL